MENLENINVDVTAALEVVSDAVGAPVGDVGAVVDALADHIETGETTWVDMPGWDEVDENTAAALLAASSPVFNPDPLHDEDIKVSRRSQEALEAALEGARTRQVVVQPAVTHLDVAAAVKILNATFSPDGGNYYPPSLLRNIIAAGSAVLLAWVDGSPVGTILSLPAWGPNGSMIQSGPMAVLPEARGKKVSLALKYSQLQWATERNLTEIRWSFDLMDRRLAKLNLHTLGAEVVEHLPGFDGVRGVDDDNTIPNDRLLVRWNLEDLQEGPTIPSDLERVWAVRWKDNELVENPHWATKPLVYLELPSSISEVRKNDPELAARWQKSVSGVLEEGLRLGFELSVTSKGTYRLMKPVNS